MLGQLGDRLKEFFMLEKVIAWFVEHPTRRTLSTSALTVLTSVMIAALMRTISQGTTIVWTQTWKSSYFYLLISIYALFTVLQSASLEYDKKISKSIAKNNPHKYVRDACLDDYANHCKDLIAKGDLKEFHVALDLLPGKGKTK
ncbi:MAG TPA: hypothetical protein PKM57_18790 [Kiritimatiellia bacterium]|nr:hypothetical protein [Kiritimatiellia bacterium]HPS09530.1 hypothetical protein [Kiritimatiellia bacterium]